MKTNLVTDPYQPFEYPYTSGPSAHPGTRPTRPWIPSKGGDRCPSEF